MQDRWSSPTLLHIVTRHKRHIHMCCWDLLNPESLQSLVSLCIVNHAPSNSLSLELPWILSMNLGLIHGPASSESHAHNAWMSNSNLGGVPSVRPSETRMKTFAVCISDLRFGFRSLQTSHSLTRVSSFSTRVASVPHAWTANAQVQGKTQATNSNVLVRTSSITANKIDIAKQEDTGQVHADRQYKFRDATIRKAGSRFSLDRHQLVLNNLQIECLATSTGLASMLSADLVRMEERSESAANLNPSWWWTNNNHKSSST
ncbi:Uncharacterized protein Y057_2355 [Fusarium fujikuroi]|nr:Uncharacterized protein Y057_2355 [Fusarium fujikuroi]